MRKGKRVRATGDRFRDSRSNRQQRSEAFTVYDFCLIFVPSFLHFFNFLNFLTRRQTKDTFSYVKMCDESIPHIFRMIQPRFVGQNHHFIKKIFSEFCRFFWIFIHFPAFLCFEFSHSFWIFSGGLFLFLNFFHRLV